MNDLGTSFTFVSNKSECGHGDHSDQSSARLSDLLSLTNQVGGSEIQGTGIKYRGVRFKQRPVDQESQGMGGTVLITRELGFHYGLFE
jgi:hypothetical protein